MSKNKFRTKQKIRKGLFNHFEKNEKSAVLLKSVNNDKIRRRVLK